MKGNNDDNFFAGVDSLLLTVVTVPSLVAEYLMKGDPSLTMITFKLCLYCFQWKLIQVKILMILTVEKLTETKEMSHFVMIEIK